MEDHEIYKVLSRLEVTAAVEDGSLVIRITTEGPIRERIISTAYVSREDLQELLSS